MPRKLFTVALLAMVMVMSVLVAPSQAAVPSKKKWLKDTRSAMVGSRAYVNKRVKQGGTRLAVNLDIDNTMIASAYGGGPVGPTLAFAARARAEGMAVFVNTARLNKRRAETREQLAAAGYVVDRLCMRRAKEAVKAGKVRCRTSFAALGYTLVANVGNNRTDFQGGGYEVAYRLPNYGGRLS